MKAFAAIILILILGSCCRFIPQKCITHTVNTLTNVRVDTFVVLKDTIIYRSIYLPGEIDHDSVPYPVYIRGNGLVTSDSLIMETTMARAWSLVENSILKGGLVQKDTVLELQFLLEGALRETTILRDSIVVINENITLLKKQTTKMKYIFGGIVFLLLLILLIRWRK